MKMLLLISVLTTFLLAQNPKIYSALGDTIYNNADKITKLQEIPSFNQYVTKIQQYSANVEKTKLMGNDIALDDAKNKKVEYLKQLRELSKTNDFFVRNVKASFESSIKNEDSKLFSALVNSGLLDTKYYKKEIIDYYLAHSHEVNRAGAMQNILDNESKLTKQRSKQLNVKSAKVKIQDAKIKRIREKDIRDQEALKKSLEEEVARKKADIIEEEKRQLGN